ncbi:MAG: formyltransferase family protein [Desulfovermiculus sp.]|nr:formyltransferase family protein [Desulfovermiculus sp.]
MNRIVIFIGSEISFSRTLLAAFLEAIHYRPQITAAAVMETGIVSWHQTLGQHVLWRVDRFFNPQNPMPEPQSYGSLKRLGAEYDVPVFISAKNDFHKKDFCHFITHELNANLALSLGCLRIYPPGLIDIFDMVVNYHNGALPAYRGIAATGWEVYHGQESVGFAYHRITKEIDEGNILLSDTVPAYDDMSIRRLEAIKTQRATQYCGQIIEKMIQRDPGSHQNGCSNYFSLQDFLKIRYVGDPGQVSWTELQKRIRCFRMAILRIKGQDVPVTEIQQASCRATPHFVTSDNVPGLVKRFFYLPYALYWAARKAGMINL